LRPQGHEVVGGTLKCHQLDERFHDDGPVPAACSTPAMAAMSSWVIRQIVFM
jgi:hypothetical protein